MFTGVVIFVYKDIQEHIKKVGLYLMNDYITELLKDIDSKSKIVNELRPLNKIALAKIRDELNNKIISNSLNIEGIHVTARETRLLLEGVQINNCDPKDIDATINLGIATKMLEEDLTKKVSIEFINTIHLRVMSSLVSPEQCGMLRNNGVIIITESEHIPPHSSKVKPKLEEAINQYYSDYYKEHVLLRIFRLHHKITNIHPYFDGNGRVSRLVMYYLLLQNKFLPLVLRDKLRYYSVLEYSDLYYDNRRLYIYFLEELQETYNNYLNKINLITEK